MIEGKKDKLAGKAKEIKGRMTGNEHDIVEGEAQQTGGKVKENVGRAKNKVQGKIEELKGELRQKAS
jgi:uncharacterized protein YjbJ (UPF0337 family)